MGKAQHTGCRVYTHTILVGELVGIVAGSGYRTILVGVLVGTIHWLVSWGHFWLVELLTDNCGTE